MEIIGKLEQEHNEPADQEHSGVVDLGTMAIYMNRKERKVINLTMVLFKIMKLKTKVKRKVTMI